MERERGGNGVGGGRGVVGGKGVGGTRGTYQSVTLLGVCGPGCKMFTHFQNY